MVEHKASRALIWLMAPFVLVIGCGWWLAVQPALVLRFAGHVPSPEVTAVLTEHLNQGEICDLLPCWAEVRVTGASFLAEPANLPEPEGAPFSPSERLQATGICPPGGYLVQGVVRDRWWNRYVPFASDRWRFAQPFKLCIKPAGGVDLDPAAAEQAVRQGARQVLEALQRADGPRLAAQVHPRKGVRFSPYAFVRTDGDLVFMPAHLRAMASDQSVYRWGYADGNGQPIEATLGGYIQGLARADYLSAPQVAYEQVIKQGNTRNNIREAYPDGVFVEFHKPGAVEQADFTWSSLRLVFEQENGIWYLVGVVQDRWTI